MEQSDTIKELAGALAKAQAEMKAAEMTAENPFLKSKYADLGEVIKASRHALTAHGLSVIQPVSFADGTVIITTQLMHESGEYIREVMAFPVGEARGKSAVQEAGSVITYLRRYSLSSLLGIYADSDTDGESKPGSTNGAQQKQESGNGKKPAAEKPNPDLDLKTGKGARLGNLTDDQLKAFITAVDEKIAAGEAVDDMNSRAYNGAKRLIAAKQAVA